VGSFAVEALGSVAFGGCSSSIGLLGVVRLVSTRSLVGGVGVVGGFVVASLTAKSAYSVSCGRVMA
jgi:hypothetical protein